jgi:hypothetical protein
MILSFSFNILTDQVKFSIAMKKIYFGVVFFVVLCSHSLYAQHFSPLDNTPTDIAYLTTDNNKKPVVKVIYSRPIKSGEQVFGTQIPYDKLWRTGDNEATEVRFYSDVRFGDQLVKAGTYVMHSIPGEKEWTIILNRNTDTLGAFFYDQSKDVVRIKAPVRNGEQLDMFSIAFDKNFNNTYMVLGWDTTRVNIPIDTYTQVLAEL